MAWSGLLTNQIQLKSLAEEMQAVSKGLEKVEQELAASENDGAISMGFRKVRLKAEVSINKVHNVVFQG